MVVQSTGWTSPFHLRELHTSTSNHCTPLRTVVTALHPAQSARDVHRSEQEQIWRVKYILRTAPILPPARCSRTAAHTAARIPHCSLAECSWPLRAASANQRLLPPCESPAFTSSTSSTSSTSLLVPLCPPLLPLKRNMSVECSVLSFTSYPPSLPPSLSLIQTQHTVHTVCPTYRPNLALSPLFA